MTSFRVQIGLCAALAASLACGGEPEVGDESMQGEVTPIAGMYRVSGSTLEKATGSKREISGTVILAEEGETYIATFDLDTAFPEGGEFLPAEVIGKGSGVIEGRTLRGEAQTQIVITTVPGIDPQFAYIPRTTTTRIVSKSITTIAPDGSVEIEIENLPAAGESYTPTVTTLRGARIAEAGIRGVLPPVSTPAAEAEAD